MDWPRYRELALIVSEEWALNLNPLYASEAYSACYSRYVWLCRRLEAKVGGVPGPLIAKSDDTAAVKGELAISLDGHLASRCLTLKTLHIPERSPSRDQGTCHAKIRITRGCRALKFGSEHRGRSF